MLRKVIISVTLSLLLSSCSIVGKIARTALDVTAIAIIAPIDVIANGKDAEIFLSTEERKKRRLNRAIQRKKSSDDNANMVFSEIKRRYHEYGQQPTFIVKAPEFLKEDINNYILNELKGIVRNSNKEFFLKAQYRLTATIKKSWQTWKDSKGKILHETYIEISIMDNDDNLNLFRVGYSASIIEGSDRKYINVINKALHSFKKCQKNSKKPC